MITAATTLTAEAAAATTTGQIAIKYRDVRSISTSICLSTPVIHTFSPRASRSTSGKVVVVVVVVVVT